MMLSTYIKMALSTIKATRWRSFLTMLGIIVGVSSVVLIVSIGEGVKRDIVGQINNLGPDLITVRPGVSVTKNPDGSIEQVRLLQALGTNGIGSLTEADLQTIRTTPGVKTAVPLAISAGIGTYNEATFDAGVVIGTTEGLPDVLQQDIEHGAFFTDEDASKQAVVIGSRVARELFKENAPIGRTMTIRGEPFIVRGVFSTFDTTPLSAEMDYNNALFIPYASVKRLNSNQAPIQQIYAKPQSVEQADTVSAAIERSLKRTHGGQIDYTILRQQDNLAIANNVLNVLTAMISAVAAISLIVGGIGIMNIMLVSVSERTREIGIRKAIGATNRQILGQFVIEAGMISFVGGLFGVIVAFIGNYLLRVTTDIRPVTTWEIIVTAIGVALAVGIVFGIAPALKAAHKNPIDALRQG